MPHHTPLIATIVVGLVLAFALGALAQRLRLSPLVGYLLAGVIVGPFTPGFVADQALATELAEIGVILLMFGVGLHFSFKDLMAVRAIAVPGAVVQIAVATLLGMALGWAAGWSLAAGLVFGLALSVASTVVLLRALQEQRIVESDRGRIAVGWLIVEDLAMVLALVMLPALGGLIGGTAPDADLWLILAVTLGKVAAFIGLMLVVGRRVIPWILHDIAHTGSRELFRLAVLALALGVAFGAAVLFNVSFALGAFLAGVMLNESPLSKQAAEDTLPLRDAFAVLFFVSVGMLFNPGIIVAEPLLVLATVLIIVVGKSIAALLIVRAFGHPLSIALTISASLAQIGEFSFILASLGVALGLMSETGRDLILAGAILSIMLNPFLFRLLGRWNQRIEAARPAQAQAPLSPTGLTGHTVVVGFGRVGSLLGSGLALAGRPLLVIEDRPHLAEQARKQGLETLLGNAADPVVLEAAGLAAARHLFVAIPGAFEAGQIVAQARAANPALTIVARAHSDAEVEHLSHNGADLTIMGEREIAHRMLLQALDPGPSAGPSPQP